MTKCCCGFGHRNVFQPIDNRLHELVYEAIDMGCTTFYVGENGEFDEKFASAVRIARAHNKNIKLILVLPYMKNKLNKEKEYYCDMYDDVVIPTELADIYYKQILTKRNEWMVDKCDIVIAYLMRDFGGAYNTVKYAEKNNKMILKV